MLKQYLKANNLPTSTDYLNKSLWTCTGNKGDIKYVQYCDLSCVDADWGRNDYCTLPGWTSEP